jgi:hypothetical protein
MAHPQPIEEWFGKDEITKPKKEVYSREQRRRAKEAAEKAEYSQADPLSDDERWFRHHNWKDKRVRVRQALADADSSINSMNAFDNCGSDCQVEWSDIHQRYRVCACYCHNRHCEPCMKAKSALITSNLRAIMAKEEKKQHRFITLTLRHNDEPLKRQIKRLYSCYKTLRSKPEWKASQKGGAATLEIKWIPGTRKWHPHLHIISQGTYLSTYWLSQIWKDITGDSHMVDIRLISADKDVAYYVGKYVTKGTNAAVWEDPAVAAEWVKAVKGVRMCATFGTWRGYKLLAREKEKPGEWKTLGSLGSFVRMAANGSQQALDILRLITEQCQYNPHKQRGFKPK